MKKFFEKNNLKLPVTFFLGILLPIVGVYAASQIEANSISFNSKNGILSTNLQDAINEVYAAKQKVCPGNKNCYKIICKRSTLSNGAKCGWTDKTAYCSGAGYTEDGSKRDTSISYGNSEEHQSSSLIPGDIFDCDVNGDGRYDRDTERFYYVSDYYNTSTKSFDDNTAVLIYSSNVISGNKNVNATSTYDNSGENFHGPRTALTQLPTIKQWSNVSLSNNTRSILNESLENTTTGGTLPSNFSYEGYSARLINKKELEFGCPNAKVPSTTTSYLDDKSCAYLLENTNFSSSSISNNGYWLENSDSSNNNKALYVSATQRSIMNANVNSSNVGIRPVIEVPKINLDLWYSRK